MAYPEAEVPAAVADEAEPGNFKRGLMIGALLSLPMWAGIVYIISILR